MPANAAYYFKYNFCAECCIKAPKDPNDPFKPTYCPNCGAKMRTMPRGKYNAKYIAWRKSLMKSG